MHARPISWYNILTCSGHAHGTKTTSRPGARAAARAEKTPDDRPRDTRPGPPAHPLVEWRKHEKDGPRIVTGDKGIRLQLEDCSEVIDGLSGLVNINVGHGRTEIRDAVAAQMGDFPV
ncbi:MAG: hypothetical protein JRG80_12110 [Deltaproteobacteria bacterium]|nr:hypothetical protein [Deltaproteobacteria bacterium]MBW2400001.1 hypothetical protein [Deltaproteobacteria bacterium]MBW2666298.1 hypothetical protein [Deltaproteobacteria bacterium]